MYIRNIRVLTVSRLVYHQRTCILYSFAVENCIAEISNVTYIPVTHERLQFK